MGLRLKAMQQADDSKFSFPLKFVIAESTSARETNDDDQIQEFLFNHKLVCFTVG